MGSNDSLPPPVPSGEPPRVPPPPPAVPQFPPTEVLPPTQVMPPVHAAPSAGPTPVPPPPGQVPPSSPAAPPNRHHLVPWIIGAAVIVVALVLVAVFALRDDNESSGSSATTVTVPPPTSVVPTSAAPTTVAPTTAPATAATTAAPTTAAPATTLPSAVVVADDTGTFTVLLLDSFQTDTSPRDLEGVTVARVSGATDLAAFEREDDHDTFGVEVIVGPSDAMPPLDQFLEAVDPGPEVCADRSTKTDYPTLNGTAQALLLDGCGTGGASAKVIMVLSFPDRGLTLMVGAQGPGPSSPDLFDFTQAVVESVVLL